MTETYDPEKSANSMLFFLFELLNLEAEEVTFSSLTDEAISLIAEESRNSDKYLVKITKFVRCCFVFAETEEALRRLLTVFDKFRRFLNRIRIMPEGSLISGQISLVVIEQILESNLVEQQMAQSLELFGILVLRAKPKLPFSIEFIKLFCEILDTSGNFTVFLMSVNIEYFKKFLKNWLLVEKKAIEKSLLSCILKYILNENESLTKRTEIANCFTTKEFILYFHNTITNKNAYDLVCSALELSTNVYIFNSKEYLYWLKKAILEADEIIKSRFITLYNGYRINVGHPNSDILQDVIKAFSYEDTCQKCNEENILVICKNIPYIQDPLNLVNDCILNESFNNEYGHISFIFLKAIIELYYGKVAKNNIERFFISIPELLKHFNNKSFEKCHILDIFLKLRFTWRFNPETVSTQA